VLGQRKICNGLNSASGSTRSRRRQVEADATACEIVQPPGSAEHKERVRGMCIPTEQIRRISRPPWLVVATTASDAADAHLALRVPDTALAA
jgi:hypothetical protein